MLLENYSGLEKIDKARHKIAEKRQKKRKATEKKKASRAKKKRKKTNQPVERPKVCYLHLVLLCC